MFALNSLAIGAASLFVVVAANHGHDLHARAHHHGVGERSEHHLQKRFGGQATYYQTGLGACGINNNPSDKIVALNSAQFGGGYPGPNCFKSITICKGSVCHGAQITDECPTCDYGSLDLSQSLFEQFASTDAGVFQMTWNFNDGSSDPPKTTKKPDPPKTTEEPKTTKKPEPTTTWEPPTTTSTKKTTTWSPPPETTTQEPTTTSSSTSSTPTTASTSEAKSSASSTPSTAAASTPGAASASAVPTPASGSGSGSSGGSNLADANQVMLALGKLAVVANGGA